MKHNKRRPPADYAAIFWVAWVAVVALAAWLSGLASWVFTWLGTFVILGVAAILYLLPGGH